MPSQGPSRGQVVGARDSKNVAGIQIVDVNDSVARRLLSNKKRTLFSEVFGAPEKMTYGVQPGDILEITIWEAPPGVLFSGLSSATSLPNQMVDANGEINVPFAGSLKVTNMNTHSIERALIRRLKGKANQPQILVRILKNNSSNVIVVGDVNASTRVPLTPQRERLLDVLASAGGVRQSVNKTTLQITRGEKVQSLPLDTIIRDPKQNIYLLPGDVVTSLFLSQTFTVLGAIGKNEEISFEAQGISLAQALPRSGGLADSRADAKGVFIFRFENPNSLAESLPQSAKTPEGKVPVIYQVNLKDPATFFVAQNFPIENGDVMYVSSAPGAQLQKFLNILQSTVYTATGLIDTQKDIRNALD